MILNISRGKAFQQCRQYAWNWDELRLYPHREADALVVGEGYHLGSEIISQTADVEEAKRRVESRMRERYAGQLILDEEKPEIERNIEWAKHATVQWAEHYDRADFRVLWPEVKGIVEIPNTEHHCWFAHRLLYPEIPFDADHGFPNPKCWQPHRLAFKTDGVIEMYKVIYLLEQKTTSRLDGNFWKKFTLDQQVRGYVYGVWKTTGVLVNGVLINAIVKHHKQISVMGQKKFQLDPINVGFEREPILVTKDDVLDFEREFVMLANEYELAFRTGNIYKNTGSCFNYNRCCYYFDLCRRGQAQIDGEFSIRPPDYVNDGYYDVLNLPKPTPLVKEIVPCQSPTENAPTTNVIE